MSSVLQRRRSTPPIAAALCLALLATHIPPARGSGDQRDEVRVTIGFLFNFAKFTRWPERPPGSPHEFIIGVMGDDAMLPALRDLLRGRSVAGMPITILQAHTAGQARTCHLLFLGAEMRGLPAVLRALEGVPVLTVSTSKGFAAQGGMIELFLRENRMRFLINRQAVVGAKLQISGELHQLAVSR